MTLLPFRDWLPQIARAPWLQKTWLLRLLYAFAYHCDILAQCMVDGVKSRYPELAPSDALPVLGRERGVRRGFAETDAQYAARLVAWLKTRRIRGSPYALMDQLAGYLTGYPCMIRVVNRGGCWYTRNADGTREYYRAVPSNWGLGQRSDYFVIVYIDAGPWLLQGEWDAPGFTWGMANMTWGTTATSEQIATMKAIIRDENPPHAKCRGLIFATDPTSFEPTGSGAGYPDATWIYWKNRRGDARYVEIDA